MNGVGNKFNNNNVRDILIKYNYDIVVVVETHFNVRSNVLLIITLLENPSMKIHLNHEEAWQSIRKKIQCFISIF